MSRRIHCTLSAAVVVLALLVLSATVLADSDCWCAQYVDLQDEVPTRSGSVFLRIAASVGLTSLSYWAVDWFGLPNAQWYKVGALVSGLSNTATAVASLMLPSERSLERDAEDIAASVLLEGQCERTIARYYASTRAHRYVKNAIHVLSGTAQILLLGPSGAYSTGDFYDYVYLITGGLDLIGGTIGLIFSSPFERAYGEAVAACSP